MIEIDYDIEPDEYGVYDGRDVAAKMIRDAYRLLAPYVNHCPACTDKLFSVIANKMIDAEHCGKTEEGELYDFIMLMIGGEVVFELFEEHRLATNDVTRALLDKAELNDGVGHLH
jgi:hypothetical protein